MDFPLYKQRVPFLIQSGLPSMRKYDLVCEPKFDSKINTKYYIEKRIIPPLMRLFLVAGIDVSAWWKHKKKVVTRERIPFPIETAKQRVIEDYMCKQTCHICRKKAKGRVCETCLENEQASEMVLGLKKNLVERNAFEYLKICRKFCDAETGDKCMSIECDLYQSRALALSYYKW
mmetsp:Transcript_9853/g.12862  ORF Transcript_9853/g.12862 Transcript_9853/m.12862 type:complete len:175 (+) Transcript_9853:68-592(+)